jgi:hypothetical protein
MTTNTVNEPLFELGEISISEASRKSIGYLNLLKALRDHSLGFWGQCSGQEIAENYQAVQDGGEIFTRFELEGTETTFYIITDGTRTRTQVVTSDEY